MGRKKEVVVLSEEKIGETEKENDGAVVLGLNDLLVALLVPILPAASQNVTAKTELAYFAWEPECKKLVYCLGYFEHTSENCCGKTIEHIAGFLVRDGKSFLHDLLAENIVVTCSPKQRLQ